MSKACPAHPYVTPLAESILKFARMQSNTWGRSSEDSIFTEFQSRGYKRATIWLAMRELYQAGYIHTITLH